jgi:hypothetical protein
MPREMAGYGAFTRARRPIDCDDGPAAGVLSWSQEWLRRSSATLGGRRPRTVRFAAAEPLRAPLLAPLRCLAAAGLGACLACPAKL